MIKKILLALAVALPLGAWAQSPKFAVVDIQGVITALPEYQKMVAELDQVQKKYQEEGAKLQQEFQAKAQEFDQLPADTPDPIKQRRQEELEGMYKKLMEYQQTASGDIERQQQALLAPIQQAVMTGIQSIGANGGYTFVFDKAMAYYQGLDVVDITDQLKNQLLKK